MYQRHIDRYLKNSFSKSIVLLIKHAKFQLYRELFRKHDNWRQIYKQTSSTFYTSSDVYVITRLRNSCLIIRNNITRSLIILRINKIDVSYCLSCNISALLSKSHFQSKTYSFVHKKLNNLLMKLKVMQNYLF